MASRNVAPLIGQASGSSSPRQTECLPAALLNLRQIFMLRQYWKADPQPAPATLLRVWADKISSQRVRTNPSTTFAK